MTLLLGVDTGGTYTDAVLIRDEAHVIASAKSLTTREDLALGIGASAATYYPAVSRYLHCKVTLPQYAAVANAIGAVVGRITMRRSGTVTTPTEGVFRVHLIDGLKDFMTEDAALQALEEWLSAAALADAQESGSENIQVTVSRNIKRTQVEAQDIFIEATISVEASGRPRISHSVK